MVILYAIILGYTNVSFLAKQLTLQNSYYPKWDNVLRF